MKDGNRTAWLSRRGKAGRIVLSAVLAAALALGGLAIAPLPGPTAATAVASTAAGAASSLSGYGRPYYSDLFFVKGGSATIPQGTARKLELVSPSGPVTWSSSNGRVASVDQAGVVKAKRPGSALITARSAAAGRSVTCLVKTYKKTTQKKARKAILSLRGKYRAGCSWTNANHYFWQATNCHCYGCVAFVGIASDKAFGKYAPIKRHAAFSKIRAGDHVRVGGRHSVIVLSKRKGSIVVAEGNYNSTFRWGRVLTKGQLKRQGFYVETRY